MMMNEVYFCLVFEGDKNKKRKIQQIMSLSVGTPGAEGGIPPPTSAGARDLYRERLG